MFAYIICGACRSEGCGVLWDMIISGGLGSGCLGLRV